MTDQELYDAQAAARELMAEAQEAARLRSRVAELEARLGAIVEWADGPQPRNVIERLLDEARAALKEAK